MALTVETGDIVAGADSYVTLSSYQAYAQSRGWTLRGVDAEDEVDLRRAFDAINRNYFYRGQQSSEDQVGAFPRDAFDGIPVNIMNAQIEMAYLIKGGLDPFATIEASKTVERQKVGPIETSATTLPTGRPRLTAIQGLLSGYLSSGAGQVSLMRG